VSELAGALYERLSTGTIASVTCQPCGKASPVRLDAKQLGVQLATRDAAVLRDDPQLAPYSREHVA
jgi:hypothetical protein